jgi:hypothetical protein
MARCVGARHSPTGRADLRNGGFSLKCEKTPGGAASILALARHWTSSFQACLLRFVVVWICGSGFCKRGAVEGVSGLDEFRMSWKGEHNSSGTHLRLIYLEAVLRVN